MASGTMRDQLAEKVEQPPHWLMMGTPFNPFSSTRTKRFAPNSVETHALYKATFEDAYGLLKHFNPVTVLIMVIVIVIIVIVIVIVMVIVIVIVIVVEIVVIIVVIIVIVIIVIVIVIMITVNSNHGTKLWLLRLPFSTEDDETPLDRQGCRVYSPEGPYIQLLGN